MGKETLEKIDRLIDAASGAIREKIESKKYNFPSEEIKALAELIAARALMGPVIIASESIGTQSMIIKKSKYRGGFPKLKDLDTIIK